MGLSLSNIFVIVCDVMDENLGISPEEISLETHLYYDLALHSIHVAELLMALEEKFQIPENVSDIFVKDFDSMLHNWPQKLSFDDFLADALDGLGFSKSAYLRHKQIEQFSSKYGVQPYSVGFICACIMHIIRVRQDNT